MRRKQLFSGIRGKYKWYVLAALILPVILYIPGILGGIPFPSESAEYTDLLITHYPYALVLKRSIIEHHALPLWSSLIYSGMPFASNPLSGLFYLPGWAAILFPLPAGISVVLALHVVFGTFGFYLFLRDEGLGEGASITGALAFGFLPKIASHYGAGHVTLIYAISWTPWLFVSSKREPSGWVSGAVAGMLFLADPRWAIYAGVFWASYIIAHSQRDILKSTLMLFFRAGATALMVAAPLVLSLIEFSNVTTRSSLSLSDMLANTLPFEMLAGLIIPGNGGNPEWAIYSGGVALCIFVIQLANEDLRKSNIFWSIWVLLSILLSVGAFYSSAEWIARIPLISMIRVPARALLIGGFSIAVITAKTIQELSIGTIFNKAVRLTTIFLINFSGLMVAGLIFLQKEINLLLIWGFVFVFLSSIVVITSIQKKEYRKIIWVGAILLIADLAFVSFNIFVVNRNFDQISKDIATESLIPHDSGYFRIYSPSYSIPQDLAAYYDLELTDGVDPMQLISYRDFMSLATGVETTGYSVSIPQFETGNPKMDNQGAKPNVELLSLLNVKYLVSHFEISDSSLEIVFQDDGKYIYKNSSVLPRAWIEEDGEFALFSVPNPHHTKIAKIISKKPNSIIVRGVGPGRLVLSEIYYPGWSATIDEEPAQIKPVYDILRSVTLVEGAHDVVFSYHPATAYLGIFIAAIFWASIFLLWIRKMV